MMDVYRHERLTDPVESSGPLTSHLGAIFRLGRDNVKESTTFGWLSLDARQLLYKLTYGVVRGDYFCGVR